ncbi:MAG: UPF0280 family protein [Desulfomonilaceae bacterium]
MRMTIEGFQGGQSRPDYCLEAARFSLAVLEEIAARRSELSELAAESEQPRVGIVSSKMWEAVRKIGATDLTPMAAVAGAVADATADFLHGFGMSKTIVNNGGDIAIRLASGEHVNVGFRPDITNHKISHRIKIAHSSGIGGVCTSGLGGRSFTRGITSATTVLAESAILADAAATAVANASFIDHCNIVRRQADELDPETDLGNLEITYAVGKLEDEFVESCLNRAINYAESLVDKGIIKGSLISIKGLTRFTEGISSLISLTS